MYGHERNSHTGGFLSGVLVGMAVGAAAGLLFAPEPGTNTRQRMADGASRLRRAAGKRYDDAAHAMHDVVERGRDAWNRGVDKFEETRAAHDSGDMPGPAI
jgi:gas vesicle protein